jgi:hypothetical protein
MSIILKVEEEVVPSRLGTDIVVLLGYQKLKEVGHYH